MTRTRIWARGSSGAEGLARGTVARRLAHEPFGWRPATLLIGVRRYRCSGCRRVWRQNLSRAAAPRAKLSRAAVRWALVGLVVGHLTVARIAEALGVSWDTANDAVLAEGQRVLIDDPGRFENVPVIGVDEHMWRHTRRDKKYVAVIIDLTPVRDGTGPARLLDMVAGRSKQAFKTWLAARPKACRDRVEVVAMEGFTGRQQLAICQDHWDLSWPVTPRSAGARTRLKPVPDGGSAASSALTSPTRGEPSAPLAGRRAWSPQ